MAENDNEKKEPFEEIAEQVAEDVKKLGDNIEAVQDELKANYEELKKLVDEGSDDVLAKERIEKLSTDIATRQDEVDKIFAESKTEREELEKKIHERIDAVEVAMQRPVMGDADANDDKVKAAKEFMIHKLSRSAGSTGVKYQSIKDAEVNIEEYETYKKAFESYLRTPDDKFLSAEESKALIVGSDPDGGYLVTPEMGNKIITKLFESSPIRQLAATESISTDAIEWLVDYDEAGAEWEEETIATTNADTPTWNKKRITVHPLATRPKISQQMIEDSSINIESWLSGKVGDKMARTEATAFVNGSGVGRPRGFLTYNDGTDTWGQIDQINMGEAATLTADGFVSVKYGLIEQYLNRGTWLMNRSTVQAAMKLKDGNGQYIWKPSMIADDPSSNILGLPVRMGTDMPAVAANALSVALADWKEAYMIVDRIGVSVQRDPYTAKPLVEFYFRKRVGGDVTNYQAIVIGKVAV
jgi:HK97 family phage major capsid protein